MNPLRAFIRATAIGGVAGAALFALMAGSATRWSLLRWQRLGDFYDVQAHSFLAGDLAVDRYPLGIEAFFHDGRAYLYQGPVPALLRLPVVAVAGDRADGRLTALSMLLALALTIAATARLHWRVRSLLRGDVAVSAFESLVVGAFSFAIGGSMLLFHVSRVWVYHEAIVWGVAFTVVAIDQLVAHRTTRSTRALALASLFATLAILSRASTGIGPLAGLSLIAVMTAVAWLRSRGNSFSAVVRTAVAAVVPLASYTAVNFAKFGTLVSVPFWDQRYSQIDDLRQEFLRANDGTLFGLQFVRTTLVRYLTPTGVELIDHFPFVDLRPPPASRHSMNALFDVIDRSAGVPIAQPLLFAAAVIGVIAIVSRADLAPLRVPALAAAASAATIFPFGYIAYRYLADAAPFLFLAAAIGLQRLIEAVPDRPLVRRAMSAVVVVAALASAWINMAVGLQYQRLWSAENDPQVVAGYLEFRIEVDRALGIDRPTVERAPANAQQLPDGVGRPGTLLMLGECDALYVSDGEVVNSVDRSPWNPVERSRRAGRLRTVITVPDEPIGTRLPLLDAGDDFFLVTYVDDRHLRIDHESNDIDRDGAPFRAKAGDRVELDINADWRVQHVDITAGDAVVLDNYYFEREPIRISWNGARDDVPTDVPLCRRLLHTSR